MMGGLITDIRIFLSSDDWFGTVILYLTEHYELILVIVAMIFIFVLCLSVILGRLRKSGAIALVPVYRFVVLFKAIGISPWLVILMLIPGVNVIMRMVFYAFLTQKFNRNIFFVPALTVLPIVFLPILAFGEGKYFYVGGGEKAGAATIMKEKPKKRREIKKSLKEKVQKINRSMERAAKEEPAVEPEPEVLSVAEVFEQRAIAKTEKAQPIEPKLVEKPSQSHVVKRASTGVAMPMMRQGEMAQKYYEEEKTRRERLLKAQSVARHKNKIDL